MESLVIAIISLVCSGGLYVVLVPWLKSWLGAGWFYVLRSPRKALTRLPETENQELPALRTGQSLSTFWKEYSPLPIAWNERFMGSPCVELRSTRAQQSLGPSQDCVPLLIYKEVCRKEWVKNQRCRALVRTANVCSEMDGIRHPSERKEVDSFLTPAQYVQKQGYRYNQPVMCVMREDGQKLGLIWIVGQPQNNLKMIKQE